MRVLLKLGGTLLDRRESLSRLSIEIERLSQSDISLVVVHGGGKQMTRYLAERGIESRFVGGLRVSTPEVIDAVLQIFAGTVNKTLVGALIGAGCRAVGLTGIDGGLIQAEQLDPALGAVGRPVRTDTRLLDVLIRGGYLPVVACVAGGSSGEIYNVNADQMAVACAAGFQADILIFLTDVRGVLDAERKLIAGLTVSGCRDLIKSGVATGGMQAKLEAAVHALAQGVKQVIIAPGEQPEAAAKLLAGERLGTRIRL